MLFDWQFAYPTLFPSLVPTSEQFSSAGGMAERALLLMSEYFKSEGIPIGYWQLDAWWYQMPCSCAGRCCGATGVGAPKCEHTSNSCIKNFVANATYFPNGLANLDLGAGFNLYHHLFCGAGMGGNDYEQSFNFSNQYVVPEQSLEFYKHLFAQGKQQRQVAFEIDYLSRCKMAILSRFVALPVSLTRKASLLSADAGIPDQRSSLTAASQWLGGMATAAAEARIPIQYCMQYPRHILESALHPAVTQARASTDYDAPENFFDFGHIALLNVALDLRPSKDNFRSKECTQCNFGSRTNVEMEAILACHSRGPVGISDGPGESDVDLVRRMITAKGRILMPSRSMFAIDAHYAVELSRRPDGEVWSSHTVLNTTIAGRRAEYRTHFVLAVGNKHSSGVGYDLQRGDLQLNATAPYLVRRWGPDAQNGCAEKAAASSCTTTWLAAGAGPHLALAPQNQSSPASWDNASRPFAHELWGVYPVLGEGFALLGELGKYVGVSETRFADLSVATDAMTVRVRGDPGEVVTVTAAVPKGSGQQNLGLRVLTAVLPKSGGEMSLSFRRLPQ